MTAQEALMLTEAVIEEKTMNVDEEVYTAMYNELINKIENNAAKGEYEITVKFKEKDETIETYFIINEQKKVWTLTAEFNKVIEKLTIDGYGCLLEYPVEIYYTDKISYVTLTINWKQGKRKNWFNFKLWN